MPFFFCGVDGVDAVDGITLWGAEPWGVCSGAPTGGGCCSPGGTTVAGAGVAMVQLSEYLAKSTR